MAFAASGNHLWYLLSGMYFAVTSLPVEGERRKGRGGDGERGEGEWGMGERGEGGEGIWGKRGVRGLIGEEGIDSGEEKGAGEGGEGRENR